MLIKSTKDYGVTSVKALVYGAPGIGKTSLAKTLPGPVLVVGAESGTLALAESDLDFIDVTQGDKGEMLSATLKLQRLQEVGQYLTTPEAQKKYETVFLDSLTEIGQVVHEAIKESDEKFKDPKNGLQLWGIYGERMRLMIKFFRDLPHYNVVFTALSRPEKDEVGRRIMGVDLSGKISDQLPGYFDEVFFYDVWPDDEGVRHRWLCTQSSEKFVAKDRSGKLDNYEEPNLGEVFKKIKGGARV